MSRASGRAAASPERIASERLGVQRARPLARHTPPDRRVGRFERQRRVVDGQFLVHAVRDDHGVIVELQQLGILQGVALEPPGGLMAATSGGGQPDIPRAARLDPRDIQLYRSTQL